MTFAKLHVLSRVVVLAVCVALIAPAAAQTPAIVIDAQSGRVLHQHDAGRHWYPASLAKVMTLYLAFEQLDAGRLHEDLSIEVSPHAAAQPAVRIGLQAGERITVGEAMLAVVILSANDAAVALAETMAGSESAFIARMDAKAGELGMHSTRFANATGLPGSEQFTTARDMAVLALALLRGFPHRYPLFSTRAFSFRGHTRVNRNALLRQYGGTDGLKTGFTCAAGYNLLASGVRDGRRAIGVVLGSRTRSERRRRMTRLLDAAFTRADWQSTLPSVDDWPASRVANRSSAAPLAPPVVLRAGECSHAAASKPADPQAGWGLLFGVFVDETAARTAVRDASARLEGVVDGGRELLLSRDFGQGASFKALLVGYLPADAGRACRHLRSAERLCVAQSPALLEQYGYASR